MKCRARIVIKCTSGESGRPLYVRKGEHQKETEKTSNTKAFTRQQRKESTSSCYKSAIAEHAARNNHIIDWDGMKCIEQVTDYKMRGIKEAMHIRSNPNNINRPQGERHYLPSVWETLLISHRKRSDKAPSQKGRGTITASTGVSSTGSTRNRRRGPRGRGRRS